MARIPTSTVRQFARAMGDIDTDTARRVLEDIGRLGGRKGDEYIKEVLNQPTQAARARGAGMKAAGRAVGTGTLAGGGMAGGGLYLYGKQQKEAALRNAQLEEEKLQIVSGVLNSQDTNANDKAAIIESMSMAGVFDEPPQDTGFLGLGGNTGSGGTAPGSLANLNPMSAFGGGISGVVVTALIVYAGYRVIKQQTR